MPTTGGPAVAGPLDDLVRRAGAAMVVRDGHWVAAHYGSANNEVAACTGAVGVADRSERSTLDLQGDDGAVDRVVEAVTHRPASRTDAVRAGHAWWCRVAPGRMVLRCEPSHVEECKGALYAAVLAEPSTSVEDLSDGYGAVEVIGPRARQVLRAAGLNPLAAAVDGDPALVVLREGGNAFEVVGETSVARAAWERLRDAGRPLGAVCVGLDALDRIAAGEHLDAERSAPLA